MKESVATFASSAATPLDQLFRIILGFWQNRALTVATELELADQLSAGPLAIDVLAERTQTHALSLFRLMRALESIGVFSQTAPRVFANTPMSELLRKNVRGSQWALIRSGMSVGDGAYEAWAGLRGSIQTGKTAFGEMYGYDCWEFLQRNPEPAARFNEAMRSLAAFTTPAATAALDWSRFPLIADVGGGTGGQLTNILNAHPTCRGILFDRQDVIASAIPHPSIECIAGNFLERVPPGADAYLLRQVIHDWADAEALTILSNVRKAMPAHGRLMLIERMVPETPAFHESKWVDLHMLVLYGGRERTEPEYRELLFQAGFELEQTLPAGSLLSLFIGRPKP